MSSSDEIAVGDKVVSREQNMKGEVVGISGSWSLLTVQWEKGEIEFLWCIFINSLKHRHSDNWHFIVECLERLKYQAHRSPPNDDFLSSKRRSLHFSQSWARDIVILSSDSQWFLLTYFESIFLLHLAECVLPFVATWRTAQRKLLDSTAFAKILSLLRKPKEETRVGWWDSRTNEERSK